jgi:hypothetical protein
MSKATAKIPAPDMRTLPPLAGDWPAYFREYGRLMTEARAALVQPVGAHPPPLVRSRAAREVEIPSAARTVRKQAEAAGWTVLATYALGWAIDAKGTTKSLAHSTALRMRRGGDLLVAVWVAKEESQNLVNLKLRGAADVPAPPAAGWKFDLAYGWSEHSPLHKLGAAALKASLPHRQPTLDEGMTA